MITSPIIVLNSDKSIVYKLTKEGVIYHVNDYFTEISGYEKSEIIGKPIEYLKPYHTPITIYGVLMDALDKKKNTNIILKDKTKDGRIYWFITEFIFNNDKDGNCATFLIKRSKAPIKPIPTLDRFYKILNKIEKHSGLEVAETYLRGFTEETGMSFNDYTKTLM